MAVLTGTPTAPSVGGDTYPTGKTTLTVTNNNASGGVTVCISPNYTDNVVGGTLPGGPTMPIGGTIAFGTTKTFPLTHVTLNPEGTPGTSTGVAVVASQSANVLLSVA